MGSRHEVAYDTASEDLIANKMGAKDDKRQHFVPYSSATL